MKRFSWPVVFLCLFCTSAKTQDIQSETTFWDRLYYGGDINGWVSGPLSYIYLAPNVGYRVTDRWSVGPGGRYLYYSVRGYEPYSAYGGSVFTEYLLMEQVFVHAEYEMLNVPRYDQAGYQFGRIWSSAVLVGGGYRMSLGDRSALMITGLWNLMDDPYYPFTSPIIRIGFAL